MAAEASVNIIATLTGLGDVQEFSKRFSTTSTPARALYHYMTQAVADTDEALEVGDVSTIDLIILKCVSNDCDLDCNFSAAFSADITVNEGEVACFKPAGTVYLKNNDAGEQSTVEYLIVGSA